MCTRPAPVCELMKALNEYIARQVNVEDNAKEHFGEARFKCQSTDEEASHMKIRVIGPDRAKNIFQACMLDEHSKIQKNSQITLQAAELLAHTPAALVAPGIWVRLASGRFPWPESPIRIR